MKFRILFVLLAGTLVLPMFLPAAQLTIGTGAAANDGTGDTLRMFAQKAQTNFTELYTGKVARAGSDIDGSVRFTTNFGNGIIITNGTFLFQQGTFTLGYGTGVTVYADAATTIRDILASAIWNFKTAASGGTDANTVARLGDITSGGSSTNYLYNTNQFALLNITNVSIVDGVKLTNVFHYGIITGPAGLWSIDAGGIGTLSGLINLGKSTNSGPANNGGAQSNWGPTMLLGTLETRSTVTNAAGVNNGGAQSNWGPTTLLGTLETRSTVTNAAAVNNGGAQSNWGPTTLLGTLETRSPVTNAAAVNNGGAQSNWGPTTLLGTLETRSPVTNAAAVNNGGAQSNWGQSVFSGPLAFTWTAISASDIDWAGGNSRSKTLTANTVFTFSNLADDRDVSVNLLQDATGTRTVTWPGGIVWFNSTNQVAVPTVNTNAGYYSHYHFWQRSGSVFGEGPSSAASVLLVNLDAGTALPILNGGTAATTAATARTNLVIAVTNAVDVKPSTPVEGQLLFFNAAIAQWTNGTPIWQIGSAVLSNLVGTVANNLTNVASGWGVQLSTTTGTLTAAATNQLSLMASNATTFQADFTGGNPLVQSADVMRVNTSIYLTNPIVGRVMTFCLRGDLNATDRTISVLTNGLTGNWPIHWGFNTPTNGATAFTVTNNIGAELSILVKSNAFSAFYSPQR